MKLFKLDMWAFNKERAIALACITATMAYLYTQNAFIGFYHGAWSSFHYLNTYYQPLTNPDPQYGYRLLPVLIVKWLSVDPLGGFILINMLSFFFAACLLVIILEAEGIRKDLAILSSILFLSFPCSLKWCLTYTAGPDPFYLLVVAASYRTIQLKRYMLFSLLLTVGVFTKPNIVVLWPVLLMYGQSSIRSFFTNRKADFIWRLATIVLPVAAYLLVQYIWPPANTGWTLMKEMKINLDMKFLQGTGMTAPYFVPQFFEVPMAFLIVFGMVAIVLVLHPRRSFRIFRGHPTFAVFFAFTFITNFLFGYDHERYQLYYAIPVLYVFCRIVQEDWAVFSQAYVFLPLIVMQIVLSDFTQNFVQNYVMYMTQFMGPETAAVKLITFSFFSLVSWCLLRWKAWGLKLEI